MVPAHGTHVFRGTSVGNHSITVFVNIYHLFIFTIQILSELVHANQALEISRVISVGSFDRKYRRRITPMSVWTNPPRASDKSKSLPYKIPIEN